MFELGPGAVVGLDLGSELPQLLLCSLEVLCGCRFNYGSEWCFMGTEVGQEKPKALRANGVGYVNGSVIR